MEKGECLSFNKIMNINKKRLCALLLINILIGIHLTLWYKFGYQRVGTFSLNGIVTLFGIGLLNSAAAFFLLVVIVTIFFGRLFCGWGCHFAFFQEISLKILNKFGVNPQIIHSRANIIQYVFLLKTITAIFEYWIIYGFPHFRTGFNDTPVMTADLPINPIIIISFLLFDAFLLICLMGSRAFCRYICPWAPMLAIFDHFSFWRIRKVKQCKGCTSCTKNCTMGIQVHEEIARYDAVVNTNCIRCLACTHVCPNGTLSYAWGSCVISITRRIKWLIPRQGYHNRYCELFLILCGLMVAYYTQKWLGSFQTFLGAAWGLCFGILVIKVIEGRVGISSEDIPSKRRFLSLGLVFASTLGWCWATSASYDTRLLLRGNRFFDKREYNRAISLYTQIINETPSNDEARAALALAYKEKGDYDCAITEYKTLVHNNPGNAALHNNLGTVYYRKGDYDLAIEEYKKAIQLNEHLVAAYGNIGLIFLQQGDVGNAILFLRKVFENEEEMLQYVIAVYKPIPEQS